MKIYFWKTALLGAVFLSLLGAGCYTTLRAPRPVVDTDSSYNVNNNWHFGFGWYQSGMSYESSYLHYYYVPWWRDISTKPEPETANGSDTTNPTTPQSGGKNFRRDYTPPYTGGFLYTPPASNPDSVSKHDVPADTTTQPVINNPQQTTKIEQKPGGKIERRRGR